MSGDVNLTNSQYELDRFIMNWINIDYELDNYMSNTL